MKGQPKSGRLTAAAIDDDADCCHHATLGADDVDCLLDAPAAGDDVFGDDEALVRRDLETAPKDEAAFRVFLGEDVTLA